MLDLMIVERGGKVDKKMNYYAHIKILDDGTEKYHTVADHCSETADYAEKALADIGFGKTAYLAGRLHDCGKCTQEFQDYLWKAVHGEKVVRGSVNHTFAGVRYILDTFHSQQYQGIDDVVDENGKIFLKSMLAWIDGRNVSEVCRS